MLGRFLNFHKYREGYILKEQDRLPKKEQSLDIPISSDINENLKNINIFLNTPKSGDLIIRNFEVTIDGSLREGFLFCFDGMTSGDDIGHFILSPLMQMSGALPKDSTAEAFISKQLISQTEVKEFNTYKKPIELVCFGNAGIIIDGIATCFVADVKSWARRGVDEPSTEPSVIGPKEGFTEMLRTNTALIRKTVKDYNLVVEETAVGEKSNTGCAVVYIKNLANASLVEEVKKRVSKIKVDYIFSSEELMNLLEESSFKIVPQILSTERPDRVAMELTDGNVAVLVNGSPFALVMPMTFFGLMKTPDSRYMRLPYANLIKTVQYISLIVSVLFSGLFVVIVRFHHEMIPTDLLYALEASVEKTPFSIVTELILLELAFEIIREAEVKSAVGGGAIGIVGGLILGQAAVSANIVSPIIIIIVAFTAVGSLGTPNYNLSLSFRIMKFLYIIFGAIFGFAGYTLCLYIHLVILASTKSFGVRFFSPLAPRTKEGFFKTVFITKSYKRTSQPDYNNTKRELLEKGDGKWRKK